MRTASRRSPSRCYFTVTPSFPLASLDKGRENRRNEKPGTLRPHPNPPTTPAVLPHVLEISPTTPRYGPTIGYRHSPSWRRAYRPLSLPHIAHKPTKNTGNCSSQSSGNISSLRSFGVICKQPREEPPGSALPPSYPLLGSRRTRTLQPGQPELAPPGISLFHGIENHLTQPSLAPLLILSTVYK